MASKGLRTHVEVVGSAPCVGGGVDGGGGGAHAEAEGVLLWRDHSQMMFTTSAIRRVPFTIQPPADIIFE